MTTPSGESSQLNVLVLAPFGRDGQFTTEILADAGISATACATVDDIELGIRGGAGVIIIAMEALLPNLAALTRLLQAQPDWSDIPLVLATTRGHGRAALDWALQELQPAGHITLLERPIRVRTLISVIRSALATRQHQYQTRGLIEELREAVSALDAEQVVRDRFVALLAHDLRGPLTVAKIAAQMIGTSPANVQRTQDLAARIASNVDRTEAMIRTMLDAHHLRSGKELQLYRDHCDLVKIARDAVEDLGLEQDAQIALQAPESLQGYWDGGLLRRAIWNLATNATKYGDRNQPVTITLDDRDDHAAVSVHNYGEALSAEEVEALFAPGTTHGKQSGRSPSWGLGLVLVHGAVAAHGGWVEVVSNPDKGTTFTLTLPVA